MIKININGNRSDIISYVSYYSCGEIAELLDVSQDEIIYETEVVDYFLHGDITFENEIIAKVTITDNYSKYIEELTNIIVKYVSYFTNKCQVYFELIDSRLVYVYEVKGKNVDECDGEHCCCHEHDEGCHCHEQGETNCNCGHHDEEYHCDCGHNHCECDK